MPLDELVGAPATGDPRVHLKPRTLHGMTVVPLTQQPGPLQAFKMVLPGGPTRKQPELQTHEGYEWLYVLSGRLRLVLGDHDLVLTRGEAADFDTRVPHWFGNAGTQAVEYLTLFGRQGERVHLRTGKAERRSSR
ncbi:MAG: cupin domain-containing protein [Geodermatophilaceae bacterium]